MMKKATASGILMSLLVVAFFMPTRVLAFTGGWTDVSFSLGGTRVGDTVYSADGSCSVDTSPHASVYVDIYEGEIGSASLVAGSFYVGAGVRGCDFSSELPGGPFYIAVITSGSVTAFRSYMASGGSPPTSSYAMIRAETAAYGIDWSAISFPLIYDGSPAIAASSSLWSTLNATDTLAALGGSCAQAGNLFAEGLCNAGVFLFTPNPGIVSALGDLASSTIPSKFPFSWFYGVSDTIGGLTASSTSNMMTIELDFHSLGVGSTSPLGLASIAPDTVVFSSSTVTHYIGSSMWALLQGLIAVAIWLAFIADVFFTVRNQMHRV